MRFNTPSVVPDADKPKVQTRISQFTGCIRENNINNKEQKASETKGGGNQSLSLGIKKLKGEAGRAKKMCSRRVEQG